MTTTIRMVDNFMSESVVLHAGSQQYKVGPHDRLRVNVPVPVCDDPQSFQQQRLELQILAKEQNIRLWETSGQVRFSRNGQWREDAEPVPRLAEAEGGRGIVVGAMGGFWFKKVNL